MRMTSLLLFPCVLAFCSDLAAQDPAPPASWTATAPMADARHSSCAVALADGRILVAGGGGVAGDLNTSEFYLAEGSFIPGPRMNTTRSQHTCTLLNDGRVLAAGGDAEGTGSAEVFDPVAGVWQLVAGTGEARRGHSATLLSDGRVLLTGGDAGNGPLDSLEIFDPETGSLISSDPGLEEARSQHSAALLSDGRVLIIGGTGAHGPLSSTEIFDPRDFSLIAGPALSTARAGHSATRLDDGRVLVAAGYDGTKETDTAEIFDSTANAWTLLPARLHSARRDQFSIVIPGNGGVLLAGGLQQGQPLAATELFLPVENTFLALGNLTLPRTGVAVAAIGPGAILAAGGRNADGPQSACGVLQVPAIQFGQGLYHPADTLTSSGSNFPPSTDVTLGLDFITPTGSFSAKGGILTSKVTTPASRTSKVNFPAVPIWVAGSLDPGRSARLTATAPGGITAVASAPIRNATSLTLTLPNALYEGLNATLTSQVVRTSNLQPMTGSVTIGTSVLTPSNSTNISDITDGTSNTFNLGESSSTTSAVASSVTPVNTTSTSILVQKGLTNLQTGSTHVTASYSGDIANDAALANGAFTVVSKTPVIQLSTTPASPQVGVPFTVSASVQTNGTVFSPHPYTGTVNFLQSGFPLGPASISTFANQQMMSSLQITPLSLSPMSLSATYGGDSFFRNASSAPLTVNIQRATPAITITSSPATYTCGQPSTFSTALTFPAAIGLANRNVGLQFLSADGTVQFISVVGLTPVGTLTVDPNTPGQATATLSAILPVDIGGVTANFTGDGLLAPATSAAVKPTLQPSAATVALNPFAGPVSNPATLTAVVTAASCGTPITGSLEFLDGTASLGVVPLGRSPFPIGLSQNAAASVAATLSVSRPAGAHNLTVKYSGDNHYQPATSPAVTVTFQ